MNIRYQKSFNDGYLTFGQALKTVLVWLVYIVLGALLLAMICGVKVYTVVGWSMQPTIDYKSVVFVMDDKDTYDIDDIISFKFAGSVNTHRIIDIEYNPDNTIKHYITKGDNPHLDSQEYIIPSRVLGRVIPILPDQNIYLTIPYVGYAILFLQEHLTALILTLVAGYIAFYVIARREDYERYDASH